MPLLHDSLAYRHNAHMAWNSSDEIQQQHQYQMKKSTHVVVLAQQTTKIVLLHHFLDEMGIGGHHVVHPAVRKAPPSPLYVPPPVAIHKNYQGNNRNHHEINSNSCHNYGCNL